MYGKSERSAERPRTLALRYQKTWKKAYSVQKRIDNICSTEFMDSLIVITWLDEANSIPAFEFLFSKVAFDELCEHYLGNIVFH